MFFFFFCGKIFGPLFFAVAVSNQRFEISSIKKNKVKPLLPWNRQLLFFFPDSLQLQSHNLGVSVLCSQASTAGAGMNRRTSQKRRGTTTSLGIIHPDLNVCSGFSVHTVTLHQRKRAALKRRRAPSGDTMQFAEAAKLKLRD